ncbi:Ras-like GTP-binding protein RhoL [Halotydeus destructor]|nr:Ras-like GTP-binding protein RhoL [Halotydeus destructor]
MSKQSHNRTSTASGSTGRSSNGSTLATTATSSSSPTTPVPSKYVKPLKIVVVGDGMVGKTCLLVSYTSGNFPPEPYVPTVFENFAGSQECDGIEHNLTLWDTAGQEDYERLRPLSYPGADAFLLCYAIDNIHSYQNITAKWHPEVKHYCPRVPYILVGTKMDLRNTPATGKAKTSDSSSWKCMARRDSEQLEQSEQDHEPKSESKRVSVTRDMGKKLAAKIKASKYVECSAKNLQGIEQVIIEVIRAAIRPKKTKTVHNQSCILL